MEKRVKEFKSEITQLRNQAENMAKESFKHKDEQLKALVKLEKVLNDNKMLKEIVGHKKEEAEIHDKEKERFFSILEHSKYERIKLSKLGKKNSELVKFFSLLIFYRKISFNIIKNFHKD